MVKMVENLGIWDKKCVKWKTEIPFRNISRVSPEIAFLDTEWKLKLTYKCDVSEDVFNMYLVNDAWKCRSQDSFKVTSFIEDPNSSLPILCNVKIVKNLDHCIWRGTKKDITDKILDFMDCGVLSMFCIFDVAPASKLLSRNKKVDSSTQTDFTSLLDSKSNGIFLWKKNPSNKGVQACVGVSSNQENLSHDLSNLLKRDTISDVTLKCGGRNFSAHKAILAARSEFFAAMFQHQVVETKTSIVDLSDLDPNILNIILEFVYTGLIPDLCEDTAFELYEAGDKYALPSLMKACSEWMIGNLTDKNCLDYLVIADTFNDKIFKDVVVNFVSENFKALEKKSWRIFEREQPGLSVLVFNKLCNKILSKQRD